MRKKVYWICIFAVAFFLAFYIDRYIYYRISDMALKGTLIPFYKYSVGIQEDFDNIVDSTSSFFKNLSWTKFKDFAVGLFNPMTILIIAYVIQFIVILRILLILWIKGSNKKYKTSKLALGLIRLVDYINKTIQDIKGFYGSNKKRVLLSFLLCSGILILLVFETFLFLIDYIVSMASFTSHILLFNIFKWLIVNVVKFILHGNKIIVISVILLVYFKVAEISAFKKLARNWARFKAMISESATVNAVAGEPGSGKTLTLSQAALAATENFLDEYERAMAEFEVKYPSFNFAKVRLLLKIFYLDFNEDELENVIKTCPNIVYDLFKLHEFINADISRMFFNEFYRGTCIVGLMPINDPYFNSFCRIGSVASMRFFQKMDSFPYEPDMTLIFPEYDKEFNSHDDKATVGEDGTFAFFALLSHLLERHGSAWLDSQDETQGIRRIRSVAGGFYHLEKRKVCMPLALKIIYKPILWLYNQLLKVILAYLGYRPKTEGKWTVRKKQVVYKRNNLSFIYQVMKYIGFIFNSIVGYLEKFQYFKIYAEYATNDEYRNSKQIHYSINVMDLEHEGERIYNSTPFKKFYDDMKTILYKEKGIKQNLLMLEKWTSLEPSLLEYAKTNLRNYSKIVHAQLDE